MSARAMAMSGAAPVAGARRQARERAMALLYEADMRTMTPAELLDDLPLEPVPFAIDIVAGVGRHHSELDAVISRYSRGWAIERMPAIDRALLRMAVFELVHCPGVPTAAVIAEAVELAQQFSTDESPRFVNGVLAAISREVRSAAGDDS